MLLFLPLHLLYPVFSVLLVLEGSSSGVIKFKLPPISEDMPGQIVSKQTTPFEFMIFEGDADHMRTVVATPDEVSPWIDPASLKLRHRIGRGLFGDVWLATQHQSAEDYDEYHEVAIKMLNIVKQDDMKFIVDKFSDVFSKCHGQEGVCWLHGISVINEKVSIIMKFYEGSIGDKMACLKGGKLSLSDALWYGMNLAEAIWGLHSKGLLVLNLKPSNFLLDNNNRAVLGDVGIPYLLLGATVSKSDMAHRLGTPHYMAPEQWEPEVRGPISFETDSWGFACSVLEMLTGAQPWCGRSVQQIYHSVVVNLEKPFIPRGLPAAVEKVLCGCFEYDFRNRPLMKDILQAFKSSLDMITGEERHTVLESKMVIGHSFQTGYTEWFLSKDHLQEGDIVRSRKGRNAYKPESMVIPEGKVVGLHGSETRDDFVLVRVHGIHDPLKVHTSTLERVTNGFAAGDWVRLKQDQTMHSPVGILHSVGRDGSVSVGFVGLETLWKGTFSELQMAITYRVGQFVRLKGNVFSPRFEWPCKKGGRWATGKITQIHANGCLVVKFPGRLPFGELCNYFLADPAEVEIISFNTSPGIVQKYQHLEDIHWAVRPILVALGLFTAMKVGFFVGKKVGKSKKLMKGHDDSISKDSKNARGGSNSACVPPSVATIIFREGAGATAAL